MWQHHSLNATIFAGKPTLARKVAAQRKLLTGCTKLVQDYKRVMRSDRRQLRRD